MSMVLVAFEPAPKVIPEMQAKDKRLEETVERMANGEYRISLLKAEIGSNSQ